MENFLEKKSQKIASIQISNQLLLQKINAANQKVQFAFERLNASPERRLKEIKLQLENLSKSLKSNHYHEILKRGFALIKNKDGELVSAISDLKIGEKIRVEMGDGAAQVLLADKLNLK